MASQRKLKVGVLGATGECPGVLFSSSKLSIFFLISLDSLASFSSLRWLLGTVGQRFLVLLSTHPNFVVHALGASARSAGQAYGKVVKWKQPTPIPQIARGLIVQECLSKAFSECEIVFSGLDHDVAGPIGKSRLPTE